MNETPNLFFQFRLLPYGPLSGFITEEIDEMLDVKHLKDVFIVDNYRDQCALSDAAHSQCIAKPATIMYDFSCSLIEEAKHVPGYEFLPIPVMNVLMDYSKNVIVSINYVDFFILIMCICNHFFSCIFMILL